MPPRGGPRVAVCSSDRGNSSVRAWRGDPPRQGNAECAVSVRGGLVGPWAQSRRCTRIV